MKEHAYSAEDLERLATAAVQRVGGRDGRWRLLVTPGAPPAIEVFFTLPDGMKHSSRLPLPGPAV